MEALIFGHILVGMIGDLVSVELGFCRGIPIVEIVGLSDDAVRKSRE